MPNIWSRTNRKIYEAFKGPRTVDMDFNKKVEEIRREEKYLAHLQSIIERFHQSRETHKMHLIEVNHFLINCYDTNSHYWPYMNDIILTHKELEKLHDNYIENVMQITYLSNDLNNRLNSIRENIKERDRLRFIHDHYDEKMEKYVRERNKRLETGKTESVEFVQGFERNDKKYKQAAKNYIDQSVRTYKMMDEYIYIKPNFINPIICQLIQEEIRFYNDSSNLMLKVNGTYERFKAADLSRPRSIGLEYDPGKFIRGQKILLAKSVISDQIVPAESSMIRIVEDIPILNTQEVIFQSIIPPNIPEKKIELEEQVKGFHNISEGILGNENVGETTMQIDTKNNGVLNVQNLYITSPNQNYLIHDGCEVNQRLKNHMIEQDDESKDSESGFSDVRNGNYFFEQSNPQSNNTFIPQEISHLRFNQSQSVPQTTYLKNTIQNTNGEISKSKTRENNSIHHNDVVVPQTNNIQTNPIQIQYLEVAQSKISENIPLQHQNVEFAHSNRIESFDKDSIPKTEVYVHPEQDHIQIKDNKVNLNYTQDHKPTFILNKDSYRYKTIESDDKVKLVYNVAPLIQSYIRANSGEQEIKEKNQEIYECEQESQNSSKKMTGVSEEFFYTDPNTNELLKVRVSLKNKNSEKH